MWFRYMVDDSDKHVLPITDLIDRARWGGLDEIPRASRTAHRPETSRSHNCFRLRSSRRAVALERFSFACTNAEPPSRREIAKDS